MKINCCLTLIFQLGQLNIRLKEIITELRLIITSQSKNCKYIFSNYIVLINSSQMTPGSQYKSISRMNPFKSILKCKPFSIKVAIDILNQW